MGDDGRRRRRPPLADGCGEDRISCLPDELIHNILICLGSTRAAARTTVLSRRWHGLWTRMPELSLSGDDDSPPTSSFLDTVDAALAAHAAPSLKRLHISVPDHGHGVPANRIQPWLHFASQRVAGEIFLDLAPRTTAGKYVRGEGAVLELPAGGAATKISLNHMGMQKVQLTGMFAALTELGISLARMDAKDLSDIVSMQCPRLKKLGLVVKLVAASDVSISSESLVFLFFSVVQNTRRLELIAPRLEDLSLYSLEKYKTLINAPKLTTLACYGKKFNPRKHQFTNVGRHLGQLKIDLKDEIILLMKRFDEVGDLRLKIFIRRGVTGYHSFLDETNKFSRCETLNISLAWEQHGFAAVILQLFKCCNSVKKLSISLARNPKLTNSCPLACPCHLVESCKIDDIVLSSLGEVEIKCFAGSPEEMEFVSQVSRCNAPVLRKLVITNTQNTASPLTKEACQKVRSMCRSDLKVEFYVKSKCGSKCRRVRYDA